VADELVRELSVPLLLVRPHEGPPRLDQEPPVRHLLLPLDGSPLAEQMIEPAVALGTLTGADYTLLRFVKPVLSLSYPVENAPVGQRVQAMLAQIEKLEAEVRREAHDYLEGVAGRMRERGLTVQTRVAAEGQPAAAILRDAAPPAVDLIALGTHGR